MKRYIFITLILIFGLVIGSNFPIVSEMKVTCFQDLGLEVSRNIEISEDRSGYRFKIDNVSDVESINKIVQDLQLVELDPKPMEPGGSYGISYYNYKDESLYTVTFDSSYPIIYIDNQRYMALYGGWHKLYSKIADIAFLNAFEQIND